MAERRRRRSDRRAATSTPARRSTRSSRSRSARTRRSRRSSSRPRTSLGHRRQLRRAATAASYMNTISWRDADDAAADGDQPARGVRAHVRRRAARRQQRRARIAAEHAASSTAVGESVARPAARPRRRAIAPSSTEYLDNVREIERRIQQAETQRTDDAARRADAPVGVPESCEEHVKLMFDLLALAYQADLTRVVHVHDGARAQHSAPIRRSASPSRITPCRTTATTAGADREAREDRTPITSTLFAQLPREAARHAGRRRHRCSITR